jgi:hypothetical protein
MPTSGLPEQPVTTETELREHADALARQWEMLPDRIRRAGFPDRLKRLQARLAGLLRMCSASTSTEELTPQLELLESTRMLQSALIAGENASMALASLPHVRVEHVRELPRAMNLAEGYLSAARGIWSPESLTTYVQQVQQHKALQLQEVMALPQTLKLAQLEFILDRADEAFAAGDLPPIEQSPFSAILHSL